MTNNLDTKNIILKNVSKIFNTSGEVNCVLDNVNLTIKEGQWVAILGPSGCGKTTLLRILAGLETYSSGDVKVFGNEPIDFRKTGKVGIAFQDSSLLPWRNVRENIHLPLEILKQNNSYDHISNLLKLVNLENFGHFKPASLSGGMRERASFARSIVSNPSLLFLDEPFSSLDEPNRQRLVMEFQKKFENHYSPTTIFITHSIDDALIMADRIILLSDTPSKIIREWKIPNSKPRTWEFLEEGICSKIRNEIRCEYFNG